MFRGFAREPRLAFESQTKDKAFSLIVIVCGKSRISAHVNAAKNKIAIFCDFVDSQVFESAAAALNEIVAGVTSKNEWKSSSNKFLLLRINHNHNNRYFCAVPIASLHRFTATFV